MHMSGSINNTMCIHGYCIKGSSKLMVSIRVVYHELGFSFFCSYITSTSQMYWMLSKFSLVYDFISMQYRSKWGSLPFQAEAPVYIHSYVCTYVYIHRFNYFNSLPKISWQPQPNSYVLAMYIAVYENIGSIRRFRVYG